MKHDEVIEIAKKAGFFFHDAGYAPTLHTTPMEYSDKCFARFAKLVEQATLERAAKVCWIAAVDHNNHEVVKLTAAKLMQEINLLKDSHD